MKIFLSLCLCLFISGCTLGLHSSSQTVALSKEWQDTVSDDFIKLVKVTFPKDKVLALSCPSQFGATLDDKLRKEGYGITSNSTTNSELVYTVDLLSPELLIVSIRIGDAWRASRVYRIKDSTLKAASSFTIQS